MEIDNKELYENAKKIADEKYKKPSAYKSGFIIKKYKELGGTFSGKKPEKTGIARWFKEEWKDIGNKEYPVYRPTKRITKKTPLTVSEIDPKQAQKQIVLKQKIKGNKNLPPFVVKGGSNEGFEESKNFNPDEERIRDFIRNVRRNVLPFMSEMYSFQILDLIERIEEEIGFIHNEDVYEDIQNNIRNINEIIREAEEDETQPSSESKQQGGAIKGGSLLNQLIPLIAFGGACLLNALYKYISNRLRRLNAVGVEPLQQNNEVANVNNLPIAVVQIVDNLPPMALARLASEISSRLSSSSLESLSCHSSLEGDIENQIRPAEGTSIKMKGGAVKDWVSPTAWSEYATAIVKGRNDYPPKMREIIKKYGNTPILRITACRTPLSNLLTAALNAASFGEFNKRFEKLPYDKLFHLDLRLELATRPTMTTVLIEKTEVLNASLNPGKTKETECSFIPKNKMITLNQLLEGAKKIQGDKFFTYSAYNNNCQDFIMAVLQGSGLGTKENFEFIKQETKELFKGLPAFRKLANTVTDVGATFNTITQGTGIHPALKSNPMDANFHRRFHQYIK